MAYMFLIIGFGVAIAGAVAGNSVPLMIGSFGGFIAGFATQGSPSQPWRDSRQPPPSRAVSWR